MQNSINEILTHNMHNQNIYDIHENIMIKTKNIRRISMCSATIAFILFSGIVDAGIHCAKQNNQKKNTTQIKNDEYKEYNSEINITHQESSTSNFSMDFDETSSDSEVEHIQSKHEQPYNKNTKNPQQSKIRQEQEERRLVDKVIKQKHEYTFGKDKTNQTINQFKKLVIEILETAFNIHPGDRTGYNDYYTDKERSNPRIQDQKLDPVIDVLKDEKLLEDIEEQINSSNPNYGLIIREIKRRLLMNICDGAINRYIVDEYCYYSQKTDMLTIPYTLTHSIDDTDLESIKQQICDNYIRRITLFVKDKDEQNINNMVLFLKDVNNKVIEKKRTIGMDIYLLTNDKNNKKTQQRISDALQEHELTNKVTINIIHTDEYKKQYRNKRMRDINYDKWLCQYFDQFKQQEKHVEEMQFNQKQKQSEKPEGIDTTSCQNATMQQVITKFSQILRDILQKIFETSAIDSTAAEKDSRELINLFDEILIQDIREQLLKLDNANYDAITQKITSLLFKNIAHPLVQKYVKIAYGAKAQDIVIPLCINDGMDIILKKNTPNIIQNIYDFINDDLDSFCSFTIPNIILHVKDGHNAYIEKFITSLALKLKGSNAFPPLCSLSIMLPIKNLDDTAKQTIKSIAQSLSQNDFLKIKAKLFVQQNYNDEHKPDIITISNELNKIYNEICSQGNKFRCLAYNIKKIDQSNNNIGDLVLDLTDELKNNNEHSANINQEILITDGRGRYITIISDPKNYKKIQLAIR